MSITIELPADSEGARCVLPRVCPCMGLLGITVNYNVLRNCSGQGGGVCVCAYVCACAWGYCTTMYYSGQGCGVCACAYVWYYHVLYYILAYVCIALQCSERKSVQAGGVCASSCVCPCMCVCLACLFCLYGFEDECGRVVKPEGTACSTRPAATGGLTSLNGCSLVSAI